MNILIIAATQFEVQPLLDLVGIKQPIIGLNKANVDFERKNIEVLMTGVGMVNTALMMGRSCLNHYDLLINVGICGAFDKNLGLGQLVNITEDILSEMGAEDGDDFLCYDQLNLPGTHVFKNETQFSFPSINLLDKVKGITVNTIHGNTVSIQKLKMLYNPAVETMEGAAFFAACLGINENYIQIRAISNYVESRNKSTWQMPLAIKNLNNFLIEFIKNL